MSQSSLYPLPGSESSISTVRIFEARSGQDIAIVITKNFFAQTEYVLECFLEFR